MNNPQTDDAAERLWYQAHDCAHAHCPHGCEHPQPFVDAEGRLVCGRCWCLDSVKVEMIPCRDCE